MISLQQTVNIVHYTELGSYGIPHDGSFPPMHMARWINNEG